ncbi:hypothetical protein PG984_005110 [Apiospora sp. TS-2023a]
MDFASDFTRPTEAIHASICNGDLARLRGLIASDQALVHSQSGRGTPLEVAVKCANVEAVRILLDAGAVPLSQEDSGRVHESAMGMAASDGHRDMSQLFREWLTSQSCLHRDQYQRLVELCLYEAATHGHGAIVFDYLNWTSFAWSERSPERAWMAAISRWEADVVDMLHPMVLKDQATIEKALCRALALKTILPEEERRGIIDYKPVDQLQQYRIVLCLLFAGGDANGLCNGDSGKPLLHMAISGTILQGGLHALLDGGANPEIQDRRGRTALHFLTWPISVDGQGFRTAFHEAGIRLLVAKGAKVTTGDAEGETPLHWAAMHGAFEVFQLYLSSCADRDAALASQNAHGETLLHYAAAGAQCRTIEFLLESGLDINATSQSGWTPLLCALTPASAGGRYKRKTQADAVQAALLLLSRGALPTTVTAEGWMALHCIGSYPDLDAPADAAILVGELVALDGMPALVNSCARGFDRLWLPRISKEARRDLYGEEPWGFRVGKTLAQCAATETAVVKEGLTPLHWAAERGAVGVTKVLLEAGADPELRDSTGSTPRKLAAKSELLMKMRHKDKDEIQRKMRELLKEEE